MGSKTQMSRKCKSLNGILKRKRGRPEGKNRVPLSMEEKRARNAHYERERRREVAEALIDLAQSLGCDESHAHADLLVKAIERIQEAATRDPSQDVTHLRQINKNMTRQIEILEEQLSDSGIHYENDA